MNAGPVGWHLRLRRQYAGIAAASLAAYVLWRRQRPTLGRGGIWTALGATSEAILMLDRDGRISFTNPAAERLLGWAGDDLHGRPLHDFVAGSGCGDGLSRCAMCVARDSGQATEGMMETLVRADGRTVEVRLSSTPLRDRTGAVAGSVLLVRDVAWRQEAEAELRDAARRLVEAEQVARMGSWEWDIVTGDVTWSPGMFTINRVDPAVFEPSFETWLETVHPDDRGRAVATLQGAVAGASSYELVYRTIRSDGELREFEALGSISMTTGSRCG